jgi:hypothetical protein
MRTRFLGLVMAVVALCPLARVAKADFVNGNFETGDLTGWTTYTTANGTLGTGLPTVDSFDTTGTGPSFAAHFNVGDAVYTGLQEGGGLLQDLALGPGSYTFSADIASEDDPNGVVNAAAGVFSLLLDGTQIAQVNLGAFTALDPVLRDTLSASFDLTTGGTHELAILITRPYGSGGDQTPQEYVDNMAVTGPPSSVPEPTSVGLMAVVAGLLVLTRRQSRAV